MPNLRHTRKGEERMLSMRVEEMLEMQGWCQGMHVFVHALPHDWVSVLGMVATHPGRGMKYGVLGCRAGAADFFSGARLAACT